MSIGGNRWVLMLTTICRCDYRCSRHRYRYTFFMCRGCINSSCVHACGSFAPWWLLVRFPTRQVMSQASGCGIHFRLYRRSVYRGAIHFILFRFFLEQLMLSGIFRRNHLQAADSFWLNQLITLHKCNLAMLACNVAVIHCDSKVLFF
jgi:hypothetical protein